MKSKQSKIDKFVYKALDRMFSMVGFDGFDESFTKQDDWYSKKSWSADDQDKFREWFIMTARKDLKWNKKCAEREFSWFNLMWGWKCVDSL